MNNEEFIFTDAQLTAYHPKRGKFFLFGLGLIHFLTILFIAGFIYFRVLGLISLAYHKYVWVGVGLYAIIDFVVFCFTARSISKLSGTLHYSIDKSGVLIGNNIQLNREDISAMSFQNDEFIGFYKKGSVISKRSAPNAKIWLSSIPDDRNKVFIFLKKMFNVPFIQPRIFKNYYFEKLAKNDWDWVSK